MAKRYYQSKADRMDESLGERRGKESGKSQSYKSRRDESMGMRKSSKESRMHVMESMRDYDKPYKEPIGPKADNYAMKQNWDGSMRYLEEQDKYAKEDARKIRESMRGLED